jgi:hypothetical protein
MRCTGTGAQPSQRAWAPVISRVKRVSAQDKTSGTGRCMK